MTFIIFKKAILMSFACVSAILEYSEPATKEEIYCLCCSDFLFTLVSKHLCSENIVILSADFLFLLGGAILYWFLLSSLVLRRV